MTVRTSIAALCALALAGSAGEAFSSTALRRIIDMHLHTIPAAWSSVGTVVADRCYPISIAFPPTCFWPVRSSGVTNNPRQNNDNTEKAAIC